MSSYCTYRPAVESQRTPSSIIRTGRRNRHGSVGTETRLTDGAIRGFETRQGQKMFFLRNVQTGCAGSAHRLFREGGGRFLRGVSLINHLHLVQTLGISGLPVSLRGLHVAFYLYQHGGFEQIRDVTTPDCHFSILLRDVIVCRRHVRRWVV